MKRAAVIVLALCVTVAAVSSACETCWPFPVYYEELAIAPSHWVNIGGYDWNDVIWTNTTVVNQQFYTDAWYVYPSGDPNVFQQPACCSSGPYYIASNGRTLILYP